MFAFVATHDSTRLLARYAAIHRSSSAVIRLSLASRHSDSFIKIKPHAITAGPLRLQKIRARRIGVMKTANSQTVRYLASEPASLRKGPSRQETAPSSAKAHLPMLGFLVHRHPARRPQTG